MTEAPSDSRLARRLPVVLRLRSFRLFYIGQSLSIVGDAIVPVALAFAVLEIGGSASDLGLVLAAGILPSIVFVLMGGVIADRVERRRLMILCDVVRWGAQSLQGVLLLTGHADLVSIIVLQLVWGTASAFFRPASTGLIAELVPARHLQQANGLYGLSENLAYTIGPALSGVLVATTGAGVALIVDAGTFAASALALALIGGRQLRPRPAPGERTSMLTDLIEGWQEFRSRTWLWTMVLWAASFHLLALPAMLVLGPTVASESLGGASAWATIATCSGIGAVVGGVIALRYHPRYLLRASFIPLGLYGLALLALAGPTAVWLIGVTAVIGGIGVAMFNVYTFTAIQQQVPLHAVSRVVSYDWLGSIAMLPVGQALIGPAAAATSKSTMLLIAGAWMLVTPALLYLVPSARNLRSVPAEPEQEADGEGAADGAAGLVAADAVATVEGLPGTPDPVAAGPGTATTVSAIGVRDGLTTD